MSRITDMHRGARLAYDLAIEQLLQPDLFSDAPPSEFWQEIRDLASDQIDESMALVVALRGSIRD